MTMRKMLAVLATLAMLCTVLPLGAIFSATADANVIENSTFDDGLQGWASSSVVSVEDGILTFECTKDWANVYKYANGMKPNTDYVYTFRAKTNMNSTMNIKINDNWAKDSAHVTFDVTTEWQEFTVDVNSGDFKSAAILMFSVNVPASSGITTKAQMEGKVIGLQKGSSSLALMMFCAAFSPSPGSEENGIRIAPFSGWKMNACDFCKSTGRNLTPRAIASSVSCQTGTLLCSFCEASLPFAKSQKQQFLQ